MWSHCCRWVRDCLDLFLPPACLLCGRRLPEREAITPFCPACNGSIAPLPAAHCRCCKHPFPNASSCHLCPGCLKRPPAFSSVYAVGDYSGALKEAIHKMKYRQKLALARPLGELLAQRLTIEMSGFVPDALLPVPIHRKRLRQRGYNQALEIARPIARALGVPVEARLLQRTRPTLAQQGLSAQDRRSNLHQAFRVNKTVAGARFLLVDDVMTTGETARACSRALVLNGAREVRVAVVARA